MVTLRVGNADYWFALKKINANGAGRYNVPALFSEGFFSMKKGSEGPKSRDFSLCIMKFQSIKSEKYDRE